MLLCVQEQMLYNIMCYTIGGIVGPDMILRMRQVERRLYSETKMQTFIKGIEVQSISLLTY